MDKIYTYNKKGEWVKVSADLKAKLIADGKRKENQFVSEAVYLENKDIPPAEFLGTNTSEKKTNQQDSNVFNRETARKEELIDMLSGLYKGDLQGVVDAIVAGKKPKFSSADQQELYGAVYNIMNARDGLDLDKLADSDNRYLKYISNVNKRKGLYTTKDGNYREPTGAEILFPNFSERQGEGAGSKAIGAFHDVMTLPTRAATAGVSALTPYSDQLSFGQQMARTVGASTGPENFFDFAVSGTPTGAGVTKGLGALSKAFRKTETLADAVKDMSKTTRGLGERMARGTGKGAREGAAYSIEPAAVMATMPDEESPWATFGEGVGLGALAGGTLGAGGAAGKTGLDKLAGKYNHDELTAYGKELMIPKESLRRLQTAARREPIKDAATVEYEYGNILNETKKAFETKLGGDRDQTLAELNKFTSFRPDKKNMKYDPEIGGFVGIDPKGKRFSVKDVNDLPDDMNFLSPHIKRGMSNEVLEKSLDEFPADIVPTAVKEWDRIRKNLSRNKFDARNVITETTRLNRLKDRTIDPDKKFMYQNFADRLRDVEEIVSNKLHDFATDAGATNNTLPQIRKSFAEGYSVMEKLPEPEKLMQSAANRLRPSTSGEFQKLIDAQESLNRLRAQYDLPKADILTPPVAAIVRGKVSPSAIGDPTLAQVVEKAGRGYVSTGVHGIGKVGKGIARGTIKGQGAVADLSEEEFVYPPLVVDMLMKDGSGRVALERPKKIYKSVDDMPKNK